MAGFNPSTWPTYNQNPITQMLSGVQNFNHNSLTNQGLKFKNDHADDLLNIKKILAQNSLRNSMNAQNNIQLQRDKLGTMQLNAVSRAYQVPGFATLAAKDPKLAAQLAQGFAGAAYGFDQTQNNQMPPAGGGVGQNSAPGMTPQNQIGQPIQNQMTPASQANMMSQPAPYQPMTPTMMPQQNTAGQPMHSSVMPSQLPPNNGGIIRVSPEEVASSQDATASSLIKKTTPDNILQQRYFNKTIDPLIEKIKGELPAASKYFGGRGQSSAGLNNIEAIFGKSPSSDYQDYLNFKQDYKNLTNEARRALGDHATDRQQKFVEEMVNPHLLSSTQDSVLSSLNNLKNIYSITDRTSQLSPAEASKTESPTYSGSPPQNSRSSVGTVRMQSTNGRFYQVKADQVDDAIKSHGWRRASG